MGRPISRPTNWRAWVCAGAIVAVALLVAAVLLVGHRAFEKQTVAYLQDYQLASVRSVAGNIEEAFNDLRNDLRHLADDPDTRQCSDDLQVELDSFLAAHSSLLSDVAIVDADGNLVLASPAKHEERNIADSPGFQAVRRTGEPYITDPLSCEDAEDHKVVRIPTQCRTAARSAHSPDQREEGSHGSGASRAGQRRARPTRRGT